MDPGGIGHNIGAADAQTEPVTSLRGWLDHLAARNRLAVATPGRALAFEVAAIAKRFDGEKAALFPAPDGHRVPVISGLVSNRGWIADAMGVAPHNLIGRFQHAANNPLPWREVKNAPVQTTAHHGTIDLSTLLPMPIHNALDSGAYVTAGLLISRSPRTGQQNVSIHRMQFVAPNRFGVYLLPRHTLAFHQEAEAEGKDLPVTIVIGVDPLTLLASQAIAPLGQDELEIAGALHGAPLEVVKSLTNDVRIPAHAEIALEGRILAKQLAPEGPFGEFPQYYGERGDRHIIEIDAVTHQSNPLFHTIIGGGLEHLLLGAIPREATLLAQLQRSFPNILDLHLSRGGTCRYHLFVKLRQASRGEAKNVILAALSSHYDIKHVVVVDEDVDIHNPTEVEWAVATRFQADRDLVVVPGAQCSKLDPSTQDGFGAKMGMDATVPLGASGLRFTRISIPGENEIDLNAVIDPSTRWTDAV